MNMPLRAAMNGPIDGLVVVDGMVDCLLGRG